METRRKRYRNRPSVFKRLQQKVVNTAATISLPALVVGATVVLLPVAWLALPVPSLPADTMIYDQFGRLVSVLYGTQNRMPVPYAAIPPDLQNGLVAIEDDTYWIEPAIDPVGILRAAIVDITSGKILQGGSTITQQLAKNLYLTDRRTFSRKLKELFITMKLSTMFDKRQILTMYLNDVYFGEGSYGAEAASQTYFGHSVKSLTLPEAALLAGLVNAPTYYDPYIHPRAAVARRNVVLQQMAKLKYITPQQALIAERAPLNLSRAAALGNHAPYFTKFVADELTQLSPAIGRHLYNGGYRVTTTMNWSMQKAAQNAVAHYIPTTQLVNGVPEPEVGLIAINPRNGYIEALVGGDNFAKTQLDRAAKAARPPGSTMKYFLYTTVIHNGFPTSSVKDSAPVRFPAGSGKWYVPHNYGHVYNGPLPIRLAIAYSDNIIAVKWMNTVGPPAMIQMAHKMGITSPLADNLTTALGSSSVTPYEMARGVSTLANGGKRIRPFGVLKVVNQTGQTVFRGHSHATQVISPQVAYVVTNLFTAPLLNPKGTAHDLRAIINRPAAAKTGTSSQQRDAWLVGFTPQLATAVWVGNDNDSPLGLTGNFGAGPIWAHFMRNALSNQPKLSFKRPPGLVVKSVCVKTGLLANGCCQSYREVFLKDHVPTKHSPGCLGGSAKGHHKTQKTGTTTKPSPSSPSQSLLKSILKSLTP